MKITACKKCVYFYRLGCSGGLDSNGRLSLKYEKDCTHPEAEKVEAAEYDYANGTLVEPISVTFLSSHDMRSEMKLCGHSARLFKPLM